MSSTLYNIYLHNHPNEDMILQDVWDKKNGFSNMTEENAQATCENIYEKLGADAFNMCRSAALSTDDQVVLGKYKQALLSGYKKDFESFKKRSVALGLISGGLNILGGFLAGRQDPSRNEDFAPPQSPPKKSVAPYVIGGILLVGVIVTVVVLKNKK